MIISRARQNVYESILDAARYSRLRQKSNETENKRMKAYNIVPGKVIVAENVEISAIILGEAGRGRVRTIVPCPASFLGLKPGLSRAGKPRLDADSSNSNSGWVARISTEGAYIRGANGNVSAHPLCAQRVTVIARGQGAFGDAGRIGTWDDLILAIEGDAEALLRIKPSRGDAYLLWFRSNGVAKVSYTEADALDWDWPLGLSTPDRRGDFVRL